MHICWIKCDLPHLVSLHATFVKISLSKMSLRIVYRMRHRNMARAMGHDELGRGSGPLGRITKLRQLVTALVRHERIEGYHFRLDEARGYAELLIMNAVKYGDRHRPTMEMADYWLMENDLVHKLFKVLAPRYKDYSASFTKLWSLPAITTNDLTQGCLELKGNPWPPVLPKERDFSKSLTNVLLEAAQKDYTARKDTSKDHKGLLPPRKADRRPYFEVKEQQLTNQIKSLRLHVDLSAKHKSKESDEEGTPV